MIKTPLFFTIHNKNEGLWKNFKSTWPFPESEQSTGNQLITNDNEPTRVQTCDDDTSLFPAKPASR